MRLDLNSSGAIVATLSDATCSRSATRFRSRTVRARSASGKSLEGRDALAAILKRIRRGDTLVVARLDRLSRSLADFAALVEKASSAGWSIVALDVGIDTGTPAGEMMVNVMATFARYERRLISERTSAATLARLSRDPEWVARQAAVLDLRKQGLSQRRIAAQLGLGKETVARALRRRPPEAATA